MEKVKGEQKSFGTKKNNLRKTHLSIVKYETVPVCKQQHALKPEEKKEH